MIHRILTLGLGALLLGSWLATSKPTPAQPAAPLPAAGITPETGFEVLARGPVHEAFAGPLVGLPRPPPIVPKEPPTPIEELPPDQQPQGINVRWIGGYWAWDDDSHDFLWVSGIWRDLPPGHQWVPGYWTHPADGWQRVPGFWAQHAQIEFLPPPPASVDSGPTTPAPADDFNWVPGSWMYRETRYLWRPGFWMRFQPNWVWAPANYTWTPAGYLFDDGHWDYPLGTRGLMFAPIRFAEPLLWAQHAWSYRPRYMVYDDALCGALFVRPDYGTYYFGDYFGGNYQRQGFTPWYEHRVNRFAYDPLFAYYRWSNRGTPWERNMTALYAGRQNGTLPLPPRTLVQQTTTIQNLTTNNVAGNSTTIKNVTFLAALEKADRTVLKLQAVAPASLAQERKFSQQHVALTQQRQKLETQLAVKGVPARTTDTPHVAKLDLPAAALIPKTNAVQPPPSPTVPKHEERVAPKADPPKPVVVTPRTDVKPLPVVAPHPTLPPPKVDPVPQGPPPKVTAPPPPKVIAPPPPPSKGTTPPTQGKKPEPPPGKSAKPPPEKPDRP